MFGENTSFDCANVERSFQFSRASTAIQAFILYVCVESHRDYLTVESKDVVSCKAFSDVTLHPIKEIIFNESPRMQCFQLNIY